MDHPEGTASAARPSLGTARYGAVHGAVRLRHRPAWPSVGERLLLATVAWLPIAVVIGVTGRAAAGCDELAGCSPLVEPLMVLGVATALLGFAAFPKLAYLGAVGTLSGLLGILPLLFIAAMTGVLRDAEPPLVAGAAAVSAAAYVLVAWWAWRDGPQPRPWLRPGT